MTPEIDLDKHRGFTLVELLVVIAIIGQLASLLLPALSGAKRQAKSAQCLSNLHQIGLGVELYVQAYGEHLPTCPMIPSQHTNWPSIMAVLAPYVTTNSVWACPADWTYYQTEHTSYEWNQYLNGASYLDPQDWSPATQTLVKTIFGTRANTPLIGDLAAVHGADRIWSGKNALFFEDRVAPEPNLAQLQSRP